MTICIEIPDKYQESFKRAIPGKDLKEYVEEHIMTVLDVTCPLNGINWSHLFSWK